ncbi:MAG TPA: class I SAM-dependent methyltransferase [Caldilineaceae bacterium]|nr:class I SAM-dependent methyltransferase [Caldilineaceae bacterium]
MNNSFEMAAAWERAAAAYQLRQPPFDGQITYGALAPTEAELKLLGDLAGRSVLDLGCGGGQNAVACALAGAEVTAVDLSAAQLAFGRELAAAHQVSVRFIQGDAANLARLVEPGLDLILAIQLFQYVEALAPALIACRDVLRPGGRLVISLDHPIRNCFYDAEEGEMVGYPARSYFATGPLAWSFEPGVLMHSYHRPLACWFASLREAGFSVEHVLEPPVPAPLLDELWPEDSPQAPLAALPHTLLLVATRNPAQA